MTFEIYGYPVPMKEEAIPHGKREYFLIKLFKMHQNDMVSSAWTTPFVVLMKNIGYIPSINDCYQLLISLRLRRYASTSVEPV